MSEQERLLRAAVQRLFAAIRQPAVDITVRRADIEVLLAVKAPLGPALPPRIQ